MSGHSGEFLPRRIVRFIRCPHHGRRCDGSSCCCSDRHFHPLKALRETHGYAWVDGRRRWPDRWLTAHYSDRQVPSDG